MMFAEKRQTGIHSARTLLVLIALATGPRPTLAAQRHVSPPYCTTSFGGSVRVDPSATVNGGSVQFGSFGFNLGTVTIPCDVTEIAARFCCPAMNGQPVTGCNDISEVCGEGCTELNCPDNQLSGSGASISCGNPRQVDWAVTCVIDTSPGILAANGRLFGQGIAHSSPDDLPAVAIVPAGVGVVATPTPSSTPVDTVIGTPTPSPECGNGIVEGTEACDDGNTVDGDCCSANCTVIYENQGCGNCSDGIDNDGDEFIDCHDSGCSLIAPLFDYAGLATRTSTSYLGGQVELLDKACTASSHCTSGDTSGVAGLCGRRFDIRRGSNLGLFSVVAGVVMFGNSGDPEVDTQAIDMRCWYATDATTTESDRTSAAVVGPGTCSNDHAQACLILDECAGASCDRRRIDDVTNAFVNRGGASPEFLQCNAAINQLVATGQTISALAGIDVSTLPLACCSDSTYSSCATPYINTNNSLVTRSSCPYLRVALASGAQVINVGAVKVAGVTELRLVGDTSTTVVMNVDKLSTGGSARVDFKDAAGNDLDPAQLLWNLKGTGAPASLKGNTVFAGTILAAERSGGIKTGASVVVHGALLGQKLKLLANTQVCHAPFCAVVP